MSGSSDLHLERSLYYGVIFMSICYGFELYMFGHTLILYSRLAPKARRIRTWYMVISSLSVCLTAIVAFNNVVFMEFMWIEHRDVEGGPLGYLAANSSVWWQTFGTAANQVTNFLGDGLLIYRCFILWLRNWKVIAVPLALYISSIVTALIMLVQSASPGSDFFKGNAVNFGVLWASLSVSINIVVTAAIVVSLLQTRRELRGHLPDDTLNLYTGVSAILIESALPFSVLGILFAITYGKHLPVSPAFLFVWATFCALSPQFIIFRVMSGSSWANEPISQECLSDFKALGRRTTGVDRREADEDIEMTDHTLLGSGIERTS